MAYLIKIVQNIEFSECNSSEVVDHVGIAQNNCIQPANTTLPTRRDAKFTTNRLQLFSQFTS